MATRKRYHVTHDSDGWKGKAEDSTRASVRGDTKAEVQKRTIDIAKKQGPSQVFIHGQNGRIQEERTYGGKDPHPPKG